MTTLEQAIEAHRLAAQLTKHEYGTDEADEASERAYELTDTLGICVEKDWFLKACPHEIHEAWVVQLIKEKEQRS